MKEKVKKFIVEQRLIDNGDRILLGLSGGADSVCLFYLLLELRDEMGFALRAAHVHHGIRLAADRDAAFVKELCEKEGVFCYFYEEDVPAFAEREGLSEEEAGRVLRYRDFGESLRAWRKEAENKLSNRAFGESLKTWEKEGIEEKLRVWKKGENDTEVTDEQKEGSAQIDISQYKIATAHHENDQAETVLFQLFRGCGLAGLRGILPKRENIIRPLLCLSREEIESSLREKGVSWCEDETNRQADYSRNKIRHNILPYADAEICGGAAAHIGKTAGVVREAEEYIKRQVKKSFQETAVIQDGAVIFDLSKFGREDIFLQKQLLLYGLEQTAAARKDIGAVHIEDILQLIKKQGNGELSLPNGLRVKKVYQKLLIYQEKAEKLSALWAGNNGFLCTAQKPEIITEKFSLTDKETLKTRFGTQNISEIMACIPQKKYTKWFDYDKIEMSFSLRHRESGDYLTIDTAMNRKPLRRYLIENKVPAALRERLWILADASHVMWVPGGRISTYYKVTDETKTILQIQICTEE